MEASREDGQHGGPPPPRGGSPVAQMMRQPGPDQDDRDEAPLVEQLQVLAVALVVDLRRVLVEGDLQARDRDVPAAPPAAEQPRRRPEREPVLERQVPGDETLP